MVENKKIIKSEDILNAFGLNSNIFSETILFLKKEIIDNKNLFNEKFKEWKLKFKKIYGKNLGIDLFLKHTYFALILKLITLNKLFPFATNNLKEINKKVTSNSFKPINIIEFEIFNWYRVNSNLILKIQNFTKNCTYSREDLFQELYQQIFYTFTRHKLGEFYTTPKLVKKMVEDFYKLNSKILDPSCGSGIFLIEIIYSILNSKTDISSKIDAIQNVYGADINPLATMTAKINILLLLLDYFNKEFEKLPKINIFLLDALFPEDYEKDFPLNIKNLYGSFDRIIGNPPWLTYKDLYDKNYQEKIRELSNNLGIKPSSQYITHIELASIFFYAIPLKFLKLNGEIFFVLTKSVIDGDHCFQFRAFSIFNNLEIWDFPKNYFFNVNHICLKAEYIGKENNIPITKKYPINVKIFNDMIELQEETYYSSLEIKKDGAKLLLPEKELKFFRNLAISDYKDNFFQGATLVPRSLVFFKIKEKKNNILNIASDDDILTRSKKKWRFTFQNKEIEKDFRFKTFLNRDLIPFCVKQFKNVFLPINEEFEFDIHYLKKFPKALLYYEEMNLIYQQNKKSTSDIITLYSNLNYWNKLKKQINNKQYIVVYNASGSNLKSAVIDNQIQKIIIGSENYYYSTESENEAYYLSAILNAPNLSQYIKLIKSSRHIHKRPLTFPIPLYNEKDENHKLLAKYGKKYHAFVRDLVVNNPRITSEKVRIFINRKLIKLMQLTKEMMFQEE